MVQKWIKNDLKKYKNDTKRPKISPKMAKILDKKPYFCRSVYIVCSRAAAIFRFLFSTCKWVESFQSYVNYDNSVGMSKILEIAWSHLLTKCHPLRSKPEERRKKMFVQKLSLGYFGLLRFFSKLNLWGS